MVTSSRIRLGTASWTDPTLVKESDWYPERSMSAEERLRFYAEQFPLVEVDATYYFPPTEDLAAKWVERTPQDFRMDVKAFGLLTHHPAKPDAVWPDVLEALPTEEQGKRSVYLHHLPEQAVELAFAHFRAALEPLDAAGKLGAVFFQFPKWFTNRSDNRRFLDSLADRLPGYRIAVEFRHRSWLDGDSEAKTLRQLEHRGLAFVCVDEPQGFASSVPPVVAATTDLAVVRFHGHNRENWERKGITPAERFRYLYTGAELAAWAPRLTGLASAASEVHGLFNNCYRDYGVRNARDLGELLDGIDDAPTSGVDLHLGKATRDELYELARQRDIEGRSTMAKAELRAVLAEHGERPAD